MNNILIVEDEHLIARLIEMTLTTPPAGTVSLWSCAAWNTICWSF